MPSELQAGEEYIHFQPQMSPPLRKTWGKLVKGLWEVPVKEESFVAQGVLRRRVMLAVVEGRVVEGRQQ